MKALTEQQCTELQRLRAKGLSYSKIAAAMGIDRSTAARRLQRIAAMTARRKASAHGAPE